jgi:15-cis-phytoene synthase
LHYEIARIAETVREPMIADIRLAWWRETVEGARAGKPRDHDVARALAATLAAVDLPAEMFARMIEARGFDAGSERFADLAALEDYAAATSGTLVQLAARALGDAQDEAAREAGIAVALCGVIRSVGFHAARGKLYLPVDLVRAAGLAPDDVLSGRGGEALKDALAHLGARALEHWNKARAMAPARAALAAFLPAALVPLYLRWSNAPLWRRQLTMIGTAWRGRL